MKKSYIFFSFLLCILCTALVSCATTSASNEIVVDHVESEMLLPDDSFAEISFFKKWSDTEKAWKAKLDSIKYQEMMRSGGSRRVNSDDRLGIGNVLHSSNETKEIRAICDVMKKNEVKYGLSAVKFDDGRIRLYTFTYFPKGRNLNSNRPELLSDFCDYFEQNHMFIRALDTNDTETMDKIDNWNKDLMTERLLTTIALKNGKDSDEFSRALYKARHTPKSVHRLLGDYIIYDKWVEVYRIYDDNGNCYSLRKPGFVIDEDGNFRAYDSYDYDNCKIVSVDKVPQEVQNAAKKSLEK